jgi:hypothetical protein
MAKFIFVRPDRLVNTDHIRHIHAGEYGPVAELDDGSTINLGRTFDELAADLLGVSVDKFKKHLLGRRIVKNYSKNQTGSVAGCGVVYRRRHPGCDLAVGTRTAHGQEAGTAVILELGGLQPACCTVPIYEYTP